MNPHHQVRLPARIGWGLGGVADNLIINTINVLGLLLYVDFFRMDPALAGVAIFIPRLIDAISDPLVGNLSDNTRSRWGRRKPYIIAGVLLSAVILPLLWMPLFPDTGRNVWYANGPFLWLVVMGSLYMLAYTLFTIPYTALGYELTTDYDERTRVLAWRMYLGLIASLAVPWIYRLCKLEIFPDEIIGARWVSVGIGMLVVASGLLPAILARENPEASKQEKLRMGEALRHTFGNRPFQILMLAYLLFIAGLLSAGNIGGFINIYHVCGGDKVFASQLGGIVGTVGAVVSYLSMFLVSAVSARLDKRRGLIIGLVISLVGIIASWWALDPRWPYAQVATTAITMLGMPGCWLLVGSMVADICDEDELRTGLRREGMFGAVNGFILKMAAAATSLIGGGMLSFAGFDPDKANAGQMSAATTMLMKNLVVGAQAVGIVLAIGVIAFYPINRRRAEETRRILDERHAASKST
jgi:GPH family glycoside/pentoside/hexuronide:cation symporter